MIRCLLENRREDYGIKDVGLYYNTESLRQAKRKTTMMYLTLRQKREVMRLVGEIGLVLLEFYLSKVNVPQYEYVDEKTAIALGWTLSKVQRHRIALTKADLFKQETYGSGERKAVITTVGERFMKGYNKQPVDPELVDIGEDDEVIEE